MPFKTNADRRHRIPRQRQRVTNWAEYDAGLRARGSLIVWLSEEAIEGWRAEARTGRGGQPKYSDLAIATALTLRAVFRLALRQTEGLIGSILALLGLDLAVPDHSTMSRRAETLEVPRPRCGRAPVHLLVASTGLRLCGPGEWLAEKHGTRRRRGWKKLHLATDADTGHIVASVLTGRDADDGLQVGPLLDRVDGSVASFTGDGAFDRDDVYGEVTARHRVAWVGGIDASSLTRVRDHAMRTYSGRPSSSMRFSASVAMATSVSCRRSVRERSPSPTTRFHLETSDSTRARTL